MKFLKHIALRNPSLIVSPFTYALLLISPVNAAEGEILEKVYRLDGVMSAGVCPDELKRVGRTTLQDFGCDRVRIDYGYRSNELVQCKLRKDLANKIIHEYNLFIEECKNKEQQP
jgi:hypothetical protein